MHYPQQELGRRQFLSYSLSVPVGLSLGLSDSRPDIVTTRRSRFSEPNDAVDRIVAERMAQYGIPGLTACILHSGNVVKHAAYGRHSIELDVSSSIRSVYQIASVSKIFAGVAAMLLVEDGRLSLDHSIGDYLPSVPASWTAIRVHDLLDHTSGLGRAERNPRFVAIRQEREDRFLPPEGLDRFAIDELIDLAGEIPLAFQPGSQWSYGQLGYALFGEIVRRTSTQTYAAFLRDRIFEPLGMAQSQFGDARVVVDGRPSAAYSRQSGVLRHWLWPFNTTDYPAAGLNTSTADLARFFAAISDGILLAQQSWERIWSPVVLSNGERVKYGLGWSVYEVDGHKAVGHEGGGCCWVTHLPEQGVTAIALSNLAGARVDTMADDLARLYL